MINQVGIAPGDRVVPWINQCSPEWPLRPLKYAAKINARTLGENIASDFEINYIDITSVDSNGRQNPAETMAFGDAPSRARRIVANGDVIISTVRTYLKAISYIDNDNDNLICSTGFAVITPSPQVHPKFLFYWVRSEWFVNEIVARSVGVSYPAINAIEIGNLPFPAISVDKQQAIVDFLDRETAGIDELIAKKQRLIDLLQEQRTALITHAITKGINPDIPTKDSGIEWLGQIPASWELQPLGINAKLIVPMRDKPPEFDGDVPWIRIEDFDGKFISDSKTGQRVSDETIRTMNLKVYPVGTVLCSCSCSMGATAIVTKPLISNQTFIGIAPSERLLSNFVFYMMQVAKDHLDSISTGSIQQYLSRNDFSRLRAPIFSIREQQAITDYLDKETTRIDNLVGTIIQAIEKLQEYRLALITAAVTGKINVR